MYFAKRYIQKALSTNEKLVALQDIESKIAFRQAFFVLISNPKMITTYLAIISLFPIVVNSVGNAVIFSLMAGIASFTGHFVFATVFSSVRPCHQ